MPKVIDIKYQNKWTGYKNYKDVTSLLPTDLSVGSKNIIIRDGAKLETRGGSSYFGAQGTVGVNTNASWTLAHRIHSDYDQFVNNQGTVMPFRVFYSGTSAKGDVLEVWLPDFLAGVAQDTKRWYQVTPTAPATPILSTHKWYWAEWYDSPNVQNRIVFTYGGTTIGSYSGGYAPVTAVAAGSITTNGTWRSKGFIEAPEGVNSVVINGVTYALSAGDFSTNTITVASSAGVSVNDVAFQSLNSDAASFGTADVCSPINNQVYYIDWMQRNVFISWNRNRTAFLGDTTYVGTSGLDDAVFSGTFTGTSTDTYTVNIDSVPPPPVRTFSPAVVGDQDNIFFSGIHTGNTTDVYQVVQNGAGPSFFYDLYFNNTFLGNFALGTPQVMGNGISVQATYGLFPTTNNDNDIWTYTVGGNDTFSWALNGTNRGSLITITGAAQLLSQGISVDFVQQTGHKVGDSWRVVAYQVVQKGWRDFIFSQPVRLPGEGFKLQLESNGWTMKPQESQMYICGQAGEYYRVEDTLSADLQSETIRALRLKSEPQKKALYPYLMSYNNDFMSIVSQEKTWDILGRQKFLELPQVRSLSDTIKYDFYSADWEDANIRYLKRNQFFTVPRTGVIYMYDDFMKYWHTPQEFARRVSSVGFIDGKIVGHSYERNETYELFTSDRNDLDVYPLNTNITTSY